MVFGQQLKLLLWKNFTLRKRQPVGILKHGHGSTEHDRLGDSEFTG